MSESVNTLSINGPPIAKISKGERFQVGKLRCSVCKAPMHDKTQCIHGHVALDRGKERK